MNSEHPLLMLTPTAHPSMRGCLHLLLLMSRSALFKFAKQSVRHGAKANQTLAECLSIHNSSQSQLRRPIMRRPTAFVGAIGLTARPSAALQTSVTSVCGRSVSPGAFASTFVPGTFSVRSARSVCPTQVHVQQAAPSTRQTPTSLAKQMDTDWNSVKVIENSVICEDHRYIVINVGTTFETGSLCDAYRFPGMYVQMRENESGKPGFFALSCAPNMQGIFEFLIKETEGTQWLTNLKVGDSVQMSPIMGKGFPTTAKLDMFQYPPIPEDALPTDILLFATGSGIAPIRAAIESRLNGINPKNRKSVKLYYGARYPERMAYMDRFKLWESDGIEVIPVMSRPDGSKEPWQGRTGYVQDALKQDGIANPKKTGVLLCGVKGMTEDVKAFCVEAGVAEDRILFNF